MSTLALLRTKESAAAKTWRETLEEIPQEQFVCSRLPAPPQSTNELTGACLRRGVRWAREGKQTVSANGALVLMQMPPFLHREQEDGTAADAGCRRLSRIPFCGALKNLSPGNQSVGAAKLRAAPRWGHLSASLQEGPPREPGSLMGSPPQALAPRPSIPASASPSAPGDVQEGWAQCPLLAGILLSRHKEAFAFLREKGGNKQVKQ